MCRSVHDQVTISPGLRTSMDVYVVYNEFPNAANRHCSGPVNVPEEEFLHTSAADVVLQDRTCC